MGTPRRPPCAPRPVQLRHECSLPGEAYVARSAWREASLERWEPGPGLEALHRHVHSLAGSAATFDAASVGDAAAPLRALLREVDRDEQALAQIRGADDAAESGIVGLAARPCIDHAATVRDERADDLLDECGPALGDGGHGPRGAEPHDRQRLGSAGNRARGHRPRLRREPAGGGNGGHRHTGGQPEKTASCRWHAPRIPLRS